MAAGGSDTGASIRYAGSTAHERGPAGPVVAVCRGDRCVGSRVGMATARGAALMGGVLWERLARVFGRGERGRERTDAERILLEADFGVEATQEILDRVSGAKDGDHDFRAALERAVIGALTPAAPSVAPGALAGAPAAPTVILVFGVNGVGKTTAVAKLGARLAHEGRSVLFAAADTFRAGAAEQLQVWADRLGVPCITGTKDPAAVAFDAIAAARARGGGIDTVLVDTARRLHTEERLLEELKKGVRVAARQQPGAAHQSLLVLDAPGGQDAVHQARAFAAAVPLTGLIVTKLDGTAKGGSVVALDRAVQVPIRFLGTGEGLGDLEVFAAERFARRLIGG